MAEIERPKRKKPHGNSKYTEELANELCERLACGESLRGICKDKAMPDHTTVIRWLSSNEEFATKYARAREIQAHVWVDEMFDLASSVPERNPQTGGYDSAAVAHIRNQVATMQWLAMKLNPKRYSERQQIDHTSSDGSMSVVERLARGRKRLAEDDGEE